MNSKEICIWLDERWCDALEKQHGVTMEELLTEYAGQLTRQLPLEEQARIREELHQEDAQRAAEAEAQRRFSLARVTENGETRTYLDEKGEDVLQTAFRVRHHLRGEVGADLRYKGAASVDELEAERYTAELLRGSERVVGVYDIDLDRGEMSALDKDEGWHVWPLKDISTAAYYANKEMHTEWPRRVARFYGRLDGRQLPAQDKNIFIRGSQPLPVDALRVSDEVSEMDGRLNFYISADFDVDGVFGTHVCTDENEDWVNVYANYDLQRGCVCDVLDISLVRADGSELSCAYRLSPEEQTALLPKLDAYCKEQTGLSLDEFRAQYFAEEQSAAASPAPPEQGVSMGQTM